MVVSIYLWINLVYASIEIRHCVGVETLKILLINLLAACSQSSTIAEGIVNPDSKTRKRKVFGQPIYYMNSVLVKFFLL